MKYFTITVDTEADNAWTKPEKIKMDNFREIPKFQELCEKYNIIPTYLLTYEYATYQPAIDYLKPKAEQGKCEIGHHLHVWTTPPFQNEKNGVDLDWIQAYQYELPDKLFKDKADSLYNVIFNNFGIKPKSHRAGRWGIDDRTIKWLALNNFRVDTSIVPGVNYTNSWGKFSSGPDFRTKSHKPYFWEADKKILEIPVSVYSECELISNILTKMNHPFMEKIINKLFKNRILRPKPDYPTSLYKKIIVNEIKQNNIINMMLHSSELARNCSPISISQKKYDHIWTVLREVFEFIGKSNIRSLSSEEIYKKLNR